jgi:hypothetical protein
VGAEISISIIARRRTMTDCPSRGALAEMPLPSLSVVIPVFREPEWIGRTIREVTLAVQRSAFDRAELVVVVPTKRRARR